jgi:RNA polymerase sigma factor (sigma-70 family)
VPPPFQRVLDDHSAAVLRFLAASVGPLDADDCFQETVIAALRAYPRLRHADNLRGWLLTIAHRKALDHHRARSRRAVPVADPDAGYAEPDQPPDDDLWRAVHALPPKQRGAVLLRFVGDLSHREIAAALGSSEEAARRALADGLAKLRKEWTPA